MSDRIEQYGTQVLALVSGFGLGEFLHGAGALDGDSDHAAQGLKRGAGERRSGNADGSGGASAQMQRSERDSALRIDDGLAARTYHLKILQWKPGYFRVGAINLPGTEQVNGGGLGAESVADIGGNRIQQFGDVIGGEQALAECVKPFDVAAALNGVGSLAAGAVREFAGDAGGDEKGEERDPVLRIGDGEGSDGGKKIIIEGERGEHGEKDGEAKSPIGGDPQDHQEESQGHGGGVYVDEAAVDLRHEFGGHEASGVAEQVLWPARFHGHDCNRNRRVSCSVKGSQSFKATGSRICETLRTVGPVVNLPPFRFDNFRFRRGE